VRLDDTRRAIEDGADEIDMVINRGAFLAGRIGEVVDEIARVAEVCCAPQEARPSGRASFATAPANCSAPSPPSSTLSASSAPSAFSSKPAPEGRATHLKVILETGELETYDNIRHASDLAISILSDFTARHPGFVGFIKTSTGKVQPAATMPVTLIMLEAVRDEFMRSGRVIGVKPAGGIRAAKQAVHYLVMVRETVGELRGTDTGGTPLRETTGGTPVPQGTCPWLTPEYFRFGASTLANDILRQVYRLKTGRYMAGYDFSEV
jgi:deoxyribose-phosphate aldolase